jgi:hypothetical protein
MLWKIARIPRYRAIRIVSGPKCTIVSLRSQLIGGCRKCGDGTGDEIGHPMSFVANPRFVAMLQNMENDCGEKCRVQCSLFGST